MNTCKIVMPFTDNMLNIEFWAFKRQIRNPFVIYADIESLLIPIHEQKSEKVRVIQKHQAHSIGYYLKSTMDHIIVSRYRMHRGRHCIEWFVNELLKIVKTIENASRKPMNQLSLDQIQKFNSTTHCHMCKKPFLNEDIRNISDNFTLLDDEDMNNSDAMNIDGEMDENRLLRKVADHCHMTGDYRGAAHIYCNLRYQEPKIIPVIFHNLSGYDIHFINKHLATAFPGNIRVIGLNKENYIMASKTVLRDKHNDISTRKYGDLLKHNLQLKFIDSFRFMASSLEKLAAYLPGDTFQILKSEWSTLTSTWSLTPSASSLELLQRKGVFPYEYMDDWTKLDELQLPEKAAFYSRLRQSGIIDAEYEFAQTIWSNFRCATLGDYSDLYLKTDVLLLADIFENFRDICKNLYGLDPVHYCTSASLTWDAMLKYTDVRIRLLADINMLMLVEKGVRGGISQCSLRYCRSNNRYFPQQFDGTQPSTFLMYFDVNNLYGYAMMESLSVNI